MHTKHMRQYTTLSHPTTNIYNSMSVIVDACAAYISWLMPLVSVTVLCIIFRVASCNATLLSRAPRRSTRFCVTSSEVLFEVMGGSVTVVSMWLERVAWMEA